MTVHIEGTGGSCVCGCLVINMEDTCPICGEHLSFGVDQATEHELEMELAYNQNPNDIGCHLIDCECDLCMEAREEVERMQ